MAATSSISAVFNAVSGPFTKGTKAVIAGLNKVSKGAKSTSSALKTLRNIEIFRSIASSVRIAFSSLNRLRSSFEGVAQSIDKSAKVARTLGLSFEGYESLALVFRESGVEATLAEAMIAKLLRRVGEARQGNKLALDTFRKLGFSMKELQTISTEDIFARTIQGLKDLGNQYDRQLYGQRLFEETGAKLGSVIDKGAAGFEEAAKAVKAFGLVLRTGQFKAVEEMNDSIARAKLSLQGLYRQVVANLAPAVQGVVKTWNDWVMSIGAENLGASLADSMMDAVIAAADWYDNVKGGVEELVKLLEPYKDQANLLGKGAQLTAQVPKEIGASFYTAAYEVADLASSLGYMAGLVDKEFRDTTRINKAIAYEWLGDVREYNDGLLSLTSSTKETAKSLGEAGIAAREWKEKAKKNRESLFKDTKTQTEGIFSALSTSISAKLASIDARSQEGVNFVLEQTTLRRQTIEQQQLAELKKILKATEANTSPGRQNILQYRIP